MSPFLLRINNLKTCLIAFTFVCFQEIPFILLMTCFMDILKFCRSVLFKKIKLRKASIYMVQILFINKENNSVITIFVIRNDEWCFLYVYSLYLPLWNSLSNRSSFLLRISLLLILWFFICILFSSSFLISAQLKIY